MLRHACGYALANKGHDTRALQAYLGHRNIQHTRALHGAVADAVQGFLAGMKRPGSCVVAQSHMQARRTQSSSNCARYAIRGSSAVPSSTFGSRNGGLTTNLSVSFTTSGDLE